MPTHSIDGFLISVSQKILRGHHHQHLLLDRHHLHHPLHHLHHQAQETKTKKIFSICFSVLMTMMMSHLVPRRSKDRLGQGRTCGGRRSRRHHRGVFSAGARTTILAHSWPKSRRAAAGSPSKPRAQRIHPEPRANEVHAATLIQAKARSAAAWKDFPLPPGATSATSLQGWWCVRRR